MHGHSSDHIVDMAKNGRLERVFSTPIFSYTFPDGGALNSELRKLILEMEHASIGVSRSNQGGWQSAPDFFQLNRAPIAELERLVTHAINIATLQATARSDLSYRVELYGWAAVNRKGHYNTTHLHPMSTWSGVYYVDPGDGVEPAGGLLEFVHPISAAAMTFFPHVLPSARVVRPQAGMVILFPSYLQHSVRTFEGDQPRICVPFNAHLTQVDA